MSELHSVKNYVNGKTVAGTLAAFLIVVFSFSIALLALERQSVQAEGNEIIDGNDHTVQCTGVSDRVRVFTDTVTEDTVTSVDVKVIPGMRYWMYRIEGGELVITDILVQGDASRPKISCIPDWSPGSDVRRAIIITKRNKKDLFWTPDCRNDQACSSSQGSSVNGGVQITRRKLASEALEDLTNQEKGDRYGWIVTQQTTKIDPETGGRVVVEVTSTPRPRKTSPWSKPTCTRNDVQVDCSDDAFTCSNGYTNWPFCRANVHPTPRP